MEPTGVFELALGEDGADIFHGDAARCGGDRIDLDPDGEFLRPYTRTWATPGSCEICCASVISP